MQLPRASGGGTAGMRVGGRRVCPRPGSVPDKLCDLSPVPSPLWASDRVGLDGI